MSMTEGRPDRVGSHDNESHHTVFLTVACAQSHAHKTKRKSAKGHASSLALARASVFHRWRKMHL